MVQVQTDAFLMPIEDATVKWPEDLSPYVPVARLRLAAQRFDSDEQLAFADVLRYNPWHSLPEHKPLGNSNRARKQMYWELARLRQAMNQVEHIEPTGRGAVPGLAWPPGIGRGPATARPELIAAGPALRPRRAGAFAVPEREEMVQIHRRGLAGAARPGPEPDDGMHVGGVGGERNRRELLDLHGRADTSPAAMADHREKARVQPRAKAGAAGWLGLGRGPASAVSPASPRPR